MEHVFLVPYHWVRWLVVRVCRTIQVGCSRLSSPSPLAIRQESGTTEPAEEQNCLSYCSKPQGPVELKGARGRRVDLDHHPRRTGNRGKGQDTALGLQPCSPPFLLSQDDPGRMHLPKFQGQTSPRPCSPLPPSGIHSLKCMYMQLSSCQRCTTTHITQRYAQLHTQAHRYKQMCLHSRPHLYTCADTYMCMRTHASS